MAAAISRLHELGPAEVYARLGSRPAGLSAAEVDRGLRDAGLNRLQTPARFRWVGALGKQFLNFFSLLLDVAAIACFVAERLQPGEGMAVLGWALLGVAVLNALFAFIQEMRAERAMEELRKYLPQNARVRRDGNELLVPAEQLAPGDVLLLGEGDRIPADVRIVEVEELLVNNAPLTGESRSQPLTGAAASGPPGDSPNLAFAGCSVIRGRGTGVVFATGRHTRFGQIAQLSQEVQRPPSPIERETTRMIRVLTMIAVGLGALFFAYGVATGRSLWVNVVFMLGIIVANVPEGLLPTLTLALSMAGLRMARKQVLVKSLTAVEALGSVHVICTDKTGTLTRNELAISAAVDAMRGEPFSDAVVLRDFFTSSLIASAVRLTAANVAGDDGPPRSAWQGDPLDVAIAERYAAEFGDAAQVVATTQRHFPFDLHKRRQAGLRDDGSSAEFAVKGAWEALRPLVARVAHPVADAAQEATQAVLEQCDTVVHRLATLGQRVIAVASRRLPRLPAVGAPEEAIERSLTLQGFLALDDPLRPEVPAAVEACGRAGIRVILITGDHPDTAAAVARQCGILSAGESAADRCIHGSELESMPPGSLTERLNDGAVVFARTTPEQKLKIVTALKQTGATVAMTGDGVNDAPALKASDVGVAMGISGTDVAREAAGIVLLDDNFASIVRGIEEGRAVYANIQKFTTYVLASNVPEIVPLLLYIVFPVPLALTVIQILSIDLGTDLLPAIGLGQEPPEEDILSRPPRKSDDRLLSWRLLTVAYLFLGLIQAGWSWGLFLLALYCGGWQWGEELAFDDPLYRAATGLTLSAVVLTQIGNVIGRRSLHGSGLDAGLMQNRLVLLGIVVEVIFSWGVLYYAPLQRFLGTGPADWRLYLLAWAGVPLLFGLDLARKRLLAPRRRAAAKAA